MAHTSHMPSATLKNIIKHISRSKKHCLQFCAWSVLNVYFIFSPLSGRFRIFYYLVSIDFSCALRWIPEMTILIHFIKGKIRLQGYTLFLLCLLDRTDPIRRFQQNLCLKHKWQKYYNFHLENASLRDMKDSTLLHSYVILLYFFLRVMGMVKLAFIVSNAYNTRSPSLLVYLLVHAYQTGHPVRELVNINA